MSQQAQEVSYGGGIFTRLYRPDGSIFDVPRGADIDGYLRKGFAITPPASAKAPAGKPAGVEAAADKPVPVESGETGEGAGPTPEGEGEGAGETPASANATAEEPASANASADKPAGKGGKKGK